MPEAFKNLLNPALVRDSAALLARHSKRFDAQRFEALAQAQSASACVSPSIRAITSGVSFSIIAIAPRFCCS